MSPSVWDIVKVPFPYTNRDVQQRRPALVVACHDKPGMPNLLWVMMITSAGHRRWPDDILIEEIQRVGLPVASVIRPVKIATIEAASAETMGQLAAGGRVAVLAFMREVVSRIA